MSKMNWIVILGSIAYGDYINKRTTEDIKHIIVDDLNSHEIPADLFGPLSYVLWDNPDKDQPVSHILTVFGSLVEQNAENIVKYFNHLSEGRLVSQGILTVDTPNDEQLVFIHDGSHFIKRT